MKVYYSIMLYLMSYILCVGQTTKQKVIVNKGCPVLSSASAFMFDELKISDKDMTTYLKAKYAKGFLRTAIEFNLIFQPATQPCCRSIVIADSTTIFKTQRDTLLKHVINYPGFNDLKINEAKHLLLLVVFDKNNKPECIFMTAHGTK